MVITMTNESVYRTEVAGGDPPRPSRQTSSRREIVTVPFVSSVVGTSGPCSCPAEPVTPPRHRVVIVSGGVRRSVARWPEGLY
jgi:hypothetical protein